MATTPVTHLLAFTLDSTDAARLANFYADLTGGQVTGVYPEHGFAQMEFGNSTFYFQTVSDYVRPQWPGQEQPQQAHLDFRVADLAEAVDHAVRLGATVASEQPGGEQWTVMIDPDGHPFCLCAPRQ